MKFQRIFSLVISLPRGRHRSRHAHPRDCPVRGSLNISTGLEKRGRKNFFHGKRWASLLQGNNLERKQFSQIVNVQISFWRQSDFRLQIVSLFSLSLSLSLWSPKGAVRMRALKIQRRWRTFTIPSFSDSILCIEMFQNEGRELYRVLRVEFVCPTANKKEAQSHTMNHMLNLILT